MIIGNGLIGKVFEQSNFNHDEYIIFASGVSNSRLEDENEFNKEKSLLKQQIIANKKIIYFSSIHVLDPSECNSMYVKHKKNMEAMIESSFSRYIIYRLPIVIGNGGNKYSLFNYIYDSIVNNTCMNIYIDSYRYLIDVQDVLCYIEKTAKTNNDVINLVFDKPFNIVNIIQCFEKIIKIKANYRKHPGGKYFKVDNSIFKNIIHDSIDLSHYSEDKYITRMIKNYYVSSQRMNTR
jgi:hypothetical protein